VTGKFSVCIVCHQAYAALSGNQSGFVGGVERQTSFLARWLAQRGHKVTMLTWNEGGPEEEVINQVRVIKICRRDQGLRGLRFFHPRWTGLVKALRRAEADVYYHNGSEGVTGQMALWCRKNRKSFVFSTASDADCNPSLPLVSKHEHFLYRVGLRKADRLVTQTATQQWRLRTEFGLDSVIIPMPCLSPCPEERVCGLPSSRRILWVGRVCSVKRPDRLLDLAQACQDLSFDFVGPFCGPDGGIEDYAQKIKERAAQIPNVKAHGTMKQDSMSRFYSNALCLCCTSEYEGFPNTFLEAWSYGLPVVSTFDPDGVIAKWNLGLAVNNILDMKEALGALAASPARYAQMSGNARQYYLRNHTVEAVLPRFESLFLETMSCRNV
jgi:glycosyltransferase involved in cell wall biosynthesis